MPETDNELLDAVRLYLEGRQDDSVQDFLSETDWNMARRPLEPQGLACLDHLDRAAEIAGANERELATLLADSRGRLRWGQTYVADDFGQRFLDNYGWVELFGTRGHFVNDAAACGFLLLGPETHYPDHHHVAEEIYVPLTGGTLWRMGDEPFAPRTAGEVIHHRSNVSHAMRTGEDPLLALYLWRGGPLAQRSVIVAKG